MFSRTSFVITRTALALRLINIVIEFDGFAPVVGEVQIHYRPIIELQVRKGRTDVARERSS